MFGKSEDVRNRAKTQIHQENLKKILDDRKNKGTCIIICMYTIFYLLQRVLWSNRRWPMDIHHAVNIYTYLVEKSIEKKIISLRTGYKTIN